MEQTDNLGRTYRSIVIRRRKSGARYHDVLYGQVSAIESRLVYIRHRSTPAEARVADFILRNEGAFLEVESSRAVRTEQHLDAQILAFQHKQVVIWSNLPLRQLL